MKEAKNCEKIVLTEALIKDHKAILETQEGMVKKTLIVIEALRLELDKELGK